MWPMNCDFRAYEVCTNFRRGLLQMERRAGVEPLNLVITGIHIMQHHLSDILRCVAICNMYYYEGS